MNLNGYLLIDCNTYERFTYRAKLSEQLQIFLYHNFNIKIGHPLPTHKMIYRLAKNNGFQIVNNEYDTKTNICILLKKLNDKCGYFKIFILSQGVLPLHFIIC